ncbi:MAG: SPOR domain-containing protein, partial [Bacteroidota bacterium]
EAGASGWTLVVYSTASRDAAQSLSRRYAQAGYRSSVLTSGSGDRIRHRVAVGQFASRDDAFRLRNRLPPQAPADTWALDLQSL